MHLLLCTNVQHAEYFSILNFLQLSVSMFQLLLYLLVLHSVCRDSEYLQVFEMKCIQQIIIASIMVNSGIMNSLQRSCKSNEIYVKD